MCTSSGYACVCVRAHCRLSSSPDEGTTGWKLYFKLYCFLDVDNVPQDGVEFAFMFEQVTTKPH